jgi:branched-chain amino acid transport system substrate-binding protein
MRKSIIVPVIIVVVIVAVVVAVLNWPRGQGDEAPTEVRLGTTLPVTGIFAGFGQQGWGMQKAVDDWNDTYGGMYLSEWDVTVPVELIIKDNQSDFTQVGPQSTELVVTDRVHALLSPDAPADLHDPTSVVANANGVPQIICGGPLEPWYYGMRSGEDDPKWPYSWLTGFAIGDPTLPNPPPRDVPGYTMVDTWFMLMDEVDALSETNGIVGVFASSDADGIGWYEAFPPLLEAHNYTVAEVDGLFPMETTDYSTIVSGWIAANVTIIWGNCPGAHFGDLIAECYTQNFQPKICCAARAALFPVDVESWGTAPPLGWGVGTEVWWSPHYEVSDGFVGVGGRTAASLAEDWATETGEALVRSIGSGYTGAQIMLDAIHRAGDVDADAINAALAETDLNTMKGWVNFDSDTHFSAVPLSFGQWFYDEAEEEFTLYIVASALDSIPEEEEPIYPLPDWWP